MRQPVLVVFAMLCLSCLLRAGECEELLLSVSPRDPYLRVLDTEDASTIEEIEISIDTSDEVMGANGLAVDPTTGVLYVLLTVGEARSPRVLATLDHETGEATLVGDTETKFAGIAFDSDGALYGVTGDMADTSLEMAGTPETLYGIDLDDGSVEEICELGNGTEGEALCYNPTEDALFHASGWNDSGDGEVIFEIIDTSDDPCPVTDIDISSTVLVSYPIALTWWCDAELFVWADGWDEVDADVEYPALYTVSIDADEITEIGLPDHNIRGLAFVESEGCQEPEFLRGDSDGNGSVSALLDARYLLIWAFSDGEDPTCEDAADVDDNGAISALSDALYLLLWAFRSEEDPPEPGTEECGPDPTDDDLGCDTPSEGCD